MAAIPKAYTPQQPNNGIPQAIPQAPDANQAFSSVPQIPQAGGVPVPSAPAPSMQTPQVGVSQVPDYQNWDASAQFKLFQSAPDIGNQEMQRAVNQRNIYQASGDTPKMAAANDWIGKVGTVMSGVPKTPTPSPYTDQYRQVTNDYNDTYNQLKTQMKTPFAYNPQTDPQAQAYKGYYDNLANESSHNAMEAMNSRGLLNSSMTAGEVAKAQNDAQLQYGTKIADLGNQAYQRYQDQIGNQSRLLGLVGQSQDRAMQGAQYDRTYDLQNRTENRMQKGQDFTEGLQTTVENRNQRQQDLDQQNKATDYTGNYDPYANVKQRMQANSAAWNGASPEEQQRLHAENIRLAQSIGGAFDPQTGEYQLPQPTRTIAGQNADLTREKTIGDLTGHLSNGQQTYQATQDSFKNSIQKALADNTISKTQADVLLGNYNAETSRYSAEQNAQIGHQNANTGQYSAEQNASIGHQNANTTEKYREDTAGMNQLYKQTQEEQRIQTMINNSPLIKKQYDDMGKLTGSSVDPKDKDALMQYIKSMPGMTAEKAKPYFVQYGLWSGN